MLKRFITAGCVCLGMVAAISSTTLAFNYDWGSGRCRRTI